MGWLLSSCLKSAVPAVFCCTLSYLPGPEHSSPSSFFFTVCNCGLQQVVHTAEEWKELLTPGQYFILRQAGTELPRSRCGLQKHGVCSCCHSAGMSLAQL